MVGGGGKFKLCCIARCPVLSRDTELLEAVKYARMIYVNPHTYVEISLRLLKNIDYMGYTTNHLYVYVSQLSESFPLTLPPPPPPVLPY